MNQSVKSHLMKFSICAVLMLVVYIPMFVWMVDRWTGEESYYGHGFLIPLVSLYFAWQRKDQLKNMEISSDMRGLILIGGALAAHLISALLRIYFLSGFSFVVALYGLVLFFFGNKTARALTFPILFLFAMIPLPLVAVSALTVKLKLAVAQVSTVILNMIGFTCVRDGSAIVMPHSYVMVGAPCSGLRSLISLLTLGLIFSYTMKSSLVRKGVLFASSVPIALGTNVIRVTVLAMVSDLYGEKAATGFFHDFSGYAMFVIAFLALMWVSRAIEQVKVEKNS